MTLSRLRWNPSAAGMTGRLKVCLLDSKLRRHVIDADDNASVADIKAAAERLCLVPPGFSARLVYQKQILSDDDTLGSAGYSPERFISLVCCRLPLAPTHAAPADATLSTASVLPPPAASGERAPRATHADALDYLEQVRAALAPQPLLYNSFLRVMADFKDKTASVDDVISRIKPLLQGHAHLLQGFNVFLPPAYRIQVETDTSSASAHATDTALQFSSAHKFVTKVKQRLEAAPGTYKLFLAALHRFHTARAAHADGSTASHAAATLKLKSDVACLFSSLPDLLSEFELFLPVLQLPSDAAPTDCAATATYAALDSCDPVVTGSAAAEDEREADPVGGRTPVAACSREQLRAVSPADLAQQPHTLSAHFQEGCRVSVAGLVSAPQHNGKTGHVRSAVDTRTGRMLVLLDDGHALNVKPANVVPSPAPPLPRASSAAPTSPSDDFPMDGLPPSFLRDFIEANGGEAAFQGLTTSQVKRQFVVPQTQASALSLCAQLRAQKDKRVQPATWFVSHPWQIQFLDLVTALESFFAPRPDAIMWLDLVSTSQHATFDRPPEWWQQTFCSAIGRMGQMVMVMTPWDNPICLTRAWCLIELYACRSSGGDFNVALPPSERRRFLNEIAARGSAFYEMLSKVNTAKSECSRDTDKQRIFAAVGRLDGGFVGLDRGVLKTFTEWLEKQLEKEIASAVGAGHADVECNMIHALGILLRDKGELDRALVMLEKCVAKRRHILGGDHPDTLDALNNTAGTLNNMGQFDRALPMYVDCLAKRKRILGDAHPDTLVSLNRLAQLYYNKHDYSRAQALHEECLAKRRLALGEDHQDTIASVNNLAGVFYARGQYSLAAEMFGECVAKNRRVLGDDHPRTFASQTNHANCLSNMGQLERAVSVLQCALATSKRILGDNHLSTITILRSLSHVYRKQGDTKSAAALQAACDTANSKLAGWRLFGEK